MTTKVDPRAVKVKAWGSTFEDKIIGRNLMSLIFYYIFSSNTTAANEQDASLMVTLVDHLHSLLLSVGQMSDLPLEVVAASPASNGNEVCFYHLPTARLRFSRVRRQRPCWNSVTSACCALLQYGLIGKIKVAVWKWLYLIQYVCYCFATWGWSRIFQRVGGGFNLNVNVP